MPRLPAVPYGHGIYRRRIRLVARGDAVRADLEDDFHRFGVVLRHDGARVAEARGESFRFPWATCPGASARIEELARLPLLARAADLSAHTDVRLHCTHMYDLFALALAHAAAGRRRRQYDVAVPDRTERRTAPTLHRDGELVLAWRVEGHGVVDPPPFAGLALRGRPFLAWIGANLDPDAAEAALVLRRAIYIALGRGTDLDAVESADRITPIAGASCHSMQPGIAEHAHRIRNATRDFTTRPDTLLPDESP
jgi:hypothetical protein